MQIKATAKYIRVSPQKARLVMEVYMAADLSAETGRAIDLPIDVGQMEQALALHG